MKTTSGAGQEYTGPVYSYIRFSSSKQEKGDSIRRQTKAAEDWCKERGLTLDSTLRDDGISAYTGKNITHGALGKFREAIKLGLIKPGSTLLVENLDRLSREEIFTAIGVFTEIILSGVRIISMMDRQEYTAETIRTNPYQLMYTIGAFVRGHEESQTKSKRIRASFSNWRKELDKRKWRSTCPAWLKFNNEDKTGFIIDEPKADVVRRIYSEYSQGSSVLAIARNLTLDKVPRPSDNETNWGTTHVYYYLTKRAVIGEYQPKERKGTGRSAVGEPIKDYYPPIIDQKLFDRVSRMISEKHKVRGRVSDKVINLFRGILRCPYCGSSILLKRTPTNRGKTSEKYVCDKAFRHQTCIAYGWERRDFEATFIEYAEAIHEEYSKVQVYKPDNVNALSSVVDRLASIEAEETRLLELYATGAMKDMTKVQAMISKLQAEREEFKKRKLDLEHSANGNKEKLFKFDLEQFLDVDLEDTKKRDVLAGVIGRLFKRIYVYHAGLPSRYAWVKKRQAEMLKTGIARNAIFYRLVKEAPLLEERFFVGVLNGIGAKAYPDLSDTRILDELFGTDAPEGSDPVKEFNEIMAKADNLE